MWIRTSCFAGVMAVLAVAGPVAAQVPVKKLRPQAVVAAEVVRLGDLIDGAGEAGNTPLFRAPDLGGVGAIRAERVVEAARELGVEGLDTRGLMAIMVHRPAREVTADDMQAAIRAALARRDPAMAEAELSLSADLKPQRAPRDETARLTAEISDFEPRSGRFTIKLSAGGMTLTTVSGTAEAMVPVAILNRPLTRGDAVSAADVSVEKRRRRDVPMGSAPNPEALAGLVAQRALSPGQVVRTADLYKPELVEQNQAVMVAYDAPGLSLSLRGKALASGPAGAVIPVQNLQSKRTIEAIVTGPGKVSARLAPKT